MRARHGRSRSTRSYTRLLLACECICARSAMHTHTHACICSYSNRLFIYLIQAAVVVAFNFPPPPLLPPKSAFAYCRVVYVFSTLYLDLSLCVSLFFGPVARARRRSTFGFLLSSFLPLVQGLPLASPVAMVQPVLQADFAQILIANQVPGSF